MKKLAACYSIFNGLELLEKSIAQIYPFVDVVIIGYQTVSNKGNKSDDIEPFIERLKSDYPTFKFVLFTPDLRENTKQNEIKKHNMLLNHARELGCTHFFMSATDHYYHQYEFMKAMQNAFDYDVTFTKMYTYYKDPTWQLTPIEDYCMPFIMKIYSHTKFQRQPGYPTHVDPAIQINTCERAYIFSENEIMMHHYSMIRIDIKNKFLNAAASIRWAKGLAEEFANEYQNYDLAKNPGIKYFQGRTIKVVYNYFDICI